MNRKEKKKKREKKRKEKKQNGRNKGEKDRKRYGRKSEIMEFSNIQIECAAKVGYNHRTSM